MDWITMAWRRGGVCKHRVGSALSHQLEGGSCCIRVCDDFTTNALAADDQ